MVSALSSSSSPSAPSSSKLRLLFDNHRVRIHDLRLAPGESIIRHNLEYPTVRWQVDDGVQGTVDHSISAANTATTSSAVGDQDDTQRKQAEEEGARCDVISSSSVAPRTVHIPDKTVFFDEAGTRCEIQNGATAETAVASDSPPAGGFRQIWFEIKQEPTRSEVATQRVLSNAIYPTDVGTDLLLENRYCRVWDFYLPPGGGEPSEPHHHVLPYVFVYVAKGRLLGFAHDGRPGLFDSINEDGDVSWFDIPDGAEQDVDYAHGGKNGYPDLPLREYLVELK